MTSTAQRLSYPRFALFYLATILVVTVVLLCLGASSLQELRGKIANLSVSNLSLKGDRLGMELERHVWALAEQFLLEPQLAEEALHKWENYQDRNIVSRLDTPELLGKHPLARQAFVSTGNPAHFLSAVAALGPSGTHRRISARTGTHPWNVTQDGPHLPFRGNGLRIAALSLDPEGRTQLFVRSLLEDRLRVGFVADMGWIQSQLIPLCSRELDIPFALASSIRLRPPLPGHAGMESAIQVPFRTLFPGWEMVIMQSLVEEQKGILHREMVLLFGSGVMLLCVLGVGVLWIVRIGRDIQNTQCRTDFFNAMSHDLKTPLALIRLYAESLSRAGFSKQDRASFCHIIERESERLHRLIERILDFSRISRGHKQYRLQKADLAPVLARAARDYGTHLRRQGFQVETDIPESLPPLYLDAEAFSRAVLNLLENAEKYAGDDKYVALSAWAESGSIVVEVKDSGVGIPPEDLQRIFDQFKRGSRPNPARGHGLGLFLVRHALDGHGGRIEVESELGKGSCFRLILPIPAPEPAFEPTGDLRTI